MSFQASIRAPFAGYRLRKTHFLYVAGVGVACVLGALAASSLGPYVASGVVGLYALVAFVSLYVKSPVAALGAIWVFEIFQAPLAGAVGYNSGAGHVVRQCTDGLVLFLLLATLARSLTAPADAIPGRLRRSWPIAIAAIAALAGAISGIQHHEPVTVGLLGGWLSLKIWLLIAAAAQLRWTRRHLDLAYEIALWVGFVVAILGLADFATHGAVASALKIDLSRSLAGTDYRSNAVQSIFTHPGEFSLFMSIMSGFTAASFAERRHRADLAFLLLFCMVDVLSLRLKGALSLAGILALLGLVRSKTRRISVLNVLLLGVLLATIVLSVEGAVIQHQVAFYTSGENTARTDLYRVGGRIAADNAPFGVGFGRFGSSPSVNPYSPVYFQYGLSNVWGLSEVYPHFISDTSWPSVMGESGYLGLVAVATGFALLAMLALTATRRESGVPSWWALGALMVLVVSLIDSVGEPTLFDWIAALSLAVAFGPLLASRAELMASADVADPHARGPSRHSSAGRASPRPAAQTWSA